MEGRNIMDMNKKFKHGVSDWTFTFEDQEILIDTVTSETVTYICNGITEIIINDAGIPNELLSLFKKGSLVKKIVQEFQCQDCENNDFDEVWTYDNMKITEMCISSQHDGFSDFSIVLRND